MGTVGSGGAEEGSLPGLSSQGCLWLRERETEGVECAAPQLRTQRARSIRPQEGEGGSHHFQNPRGRPLTLLPE